MSTIIRLVGLAQGTPATNHDGRYVVEYDPFQVTDSIIGAHLVTTDDPAKARVFKGVAEVQQFWARSRGTRLDGKPDRPLTAFTIQTEAAPNDQLEGAPR